MIVTLLLRFGRSLARKYPVSIGARAVMGQLASLPLVIAGIVLAVHGDGGLYWLVPAVIFSFLLALIDAWVLLVEIKR